MRTVHRIDFSTPKHGGPRCLPLINNCIRICMQLVLNSSWKWDLLTTEMCQINVTYMLCLHLLWHIYLFWHMWYVSIIWNVIVLAVSRGLARRLSEPLPSAEFHDKEGSGSVHHPTAAGHRHCGLSSQETTP